MTKPLRLQQWTISSGIGRTEFVLLAQLTPDQTDFSLAIVCNRKAFIIDPGFQDEFNETFIQALSDSIVRYDFNSPSIMDLMKSPMLIDIIHRMCIGFFGGTAEDAPVTFNAKEAAQLEAQTIDTGEPLATIMEVKEQLDSFEPEADKPEVTENPEPVQEEQSDTQTECTSEIPEAESVTKSEEPVEEVVTGIAIPTAMDKLVSDANLVLRNLKKISDLQRIGAYAELDANHMQDLQTEIDNLKNKLAQTLLWM